MDSLVLSLQSDALDGTSSVSQLLRKSRALAVKLNSAELTEWVSQELNGYGPDADVPEYRKISGRPMYRNPYHGLQPVVIQDEFTEKLISSRGVLQSVAELESIAEGSETIYMPFPNAVKEYIMSNAGLPIEPILVVQKASVAGILESVRNTILEWTLELESKGVLGEGLRFSSSDKENAAVATYQFVNNIGAMHGSHIQQDGENISNMIDSGDMGQLLDVLSRLAEDMEKLALTEPSERSIGTEVATIQAQSRSPNPRYEVIGSALDSIKSILEAAAGNVVAMAYINELGGFG